MWRLAILLPAELPMKGPKKVASSISSLPTAALKLELSISLRLGSQTVKKQKTGVTAGTLNKFSDNRDLVDTTELGETPLVKKPKLTRPGPEFWPSVPSADARLLHSWAFPIHWCNAPRDVSSLTYNAFPATFYWSYLFIIFIKLSDWCWGCAAVAECLPSMFKTLYLIPKHCKNKNKTKQYRGITLAIFTSLWQKIWQEASKGGGAYLGWHFQSAVVCEALERCGSLWQRGLTSWQIRSGTENWVGLILKESLQLTHLCQCQLYSHLRSSSVSLISFTS